MRHVRSRKTPRDGSTVADSPRRWPRAETSGPGGVGPPDGLVELVRVAEQDDEATRRLADGEGVREARLCRLVDDENVHGAGISSRAHIHAVPAARFASPAASASTTSALEPAWTMRSSGQPSPSFAFLDPADFDRRAVGRLAHGVEQVGDHTLWLSTVTPTRFPPASRSRIIRAPV